MIIVSLLLGLLGIIAFVWLLVGMPVGGVWLLLYLLRGDKKKTLPIKKWILVTFGGLVLLPIVFVGYTLLFVVRAVNSNDMIGDSFPEISPTETVRPFNPKKYGDVCRVDIQCQGIAGVDCNQAVDGPYYYVDMRSEEILARCGGALMAPGGTVEKCAELHDKLQTCK